MKKGKIGVVQWCNEFCEPDVKFGPGLTMMRNSP